MSETPAIPVEMIDKAAEALAETMVGAGYLFTGRYSHMENVRDLWRRRAVLVLAAALRAGETRTEWGVRTDGVVSDAVDESVARRWLAFDASREWQSTLVYRTVHVGSWVEVPDA